MKTKENEMIDKYLDFGRKLKKGWNMKVTVIPIISGALGTTPKGLVRGLEELEIRRRAEAIQITALLRPARILRRVLGLEKTCYHLDSSKKPSGEAGVKNS